VHLAKLISRQGLRTAIGCALPLRMRRNPPSSCAPPVAAALRARFVAPSTQVSQAKKLK
jgi:hypothetical protein